MVRKPFYRESRKCWYIKDECGRFIRLDTNRRKAFDKWHQMERALSTAGPTATVLGVAQAFLSAVRPQMTEESFYRLEFFLVDFCGAYEGLMESVTIADAMRWLNDPKQGRLRKPDADGKERRSPPKVWSVARQRDAATALKRFFRWAHNEGSITKNPVAGLRVESPAPRDQLVDVDHHSALVRQAMATKYRSFALYLIACRSGARPINIREVTAKNFDGRQWVFQNHKTRKKTGRPLVVYLSPCLQTLSRILAHQYPKGPLFRNHKGEAWKKDTVVQRFRRMAQSIGLPPGTVNYSYRHTFATDSLLAGNSIATTAALLGHTSPQLVSQVYGHLDQHQQHLLEAAAKARK